MIEIHLDGKPVTKLQAARAVSIVGGEYVSVGYQVAGVSQGADDVTVHPRQRAYGEVRRPQVSWSSIGPVCAEAARAFAEAIAAGAEIAELAEMIAAEQVVEFTSDSRLTPARCQKPGEHGPNLVGAVVDCDIAAHHESAPSLVGRIVEDAHDDSPVPVTGKVVRQVDEETVEVLWGDLKFWPNPGHGSREPIDALRPAREQAGA